MRFLLGILVVLAYFAGAAPVFAAQQCSTPVTYSVQAIDPRFALSTSTAIGALQKAESIWESPTGRNVFTFSSTSPAVPVSFVYDARQMSVDENKQTIAKFKLVKQTFTALDDAYDQIASSTKKDQTSLNERFAAYKADLASYNSDVAAVNARGGATPQEAGLLTGRQADLNARFDALKKEETALNIHIEKLNTLGSSLNALAAAVNAAIARYNDALSKSPGHEAGLYMRQGDTQKITIFEFADDDDLTRVLAHELGHALGLNHVSDSKSIMFASSSTSTSETATEADLTEFYTVCGR